MNLVEMPDSLAYVWDWYLRLNETRPVGMGMSAITYTEIRSYFELMDIEVEPFEVELIKVFDRLSLTASYKEQEKQTKAQQLKQKHKSK